MQLIERKNTNKFENLTFFETLMLYIIKEQNLFLIQKTKKQNSMVLLIHIETSSWPSFGW